MEMVGQSPQRTSLLENLNKVLQSNKEKVTKLKETKEKTNKGIN